MIGKITALHDTFFAALTRFAGDWLMGLAARLAFSSVLMLFFLNSAATKLGSGFPGMFQPQVGAYAQIVPPLAEASGYDVSQISFIPWGIIVYAGTYAEILIPLAIFLGLFTRTASVAMIGFIVVMSFVDIQFHGLAAKDVGMFFDRIHNSIILDQRLLWVLPLIYLAIHGGGRVSLDHLLAKRRGDGLD